MVKPSIPKGTRDFGPEQLYKRQYIFSTVRKVFEKYGFQPIETPTMENLSTLTGKYGEEGDKLLFKVLNSGDYLKKANKEALEAQDSSALASSICEKGLRYDLTIPFARYVVMNQHAISFPFKRYQIQPVWRADRPQKGRYREFYQCDVDVVGSDSLLNEVELVQIYDEVFSKLGLNVTIRLNNRKILNGFCEVLGVTNPIEFINILDRIDKVPFEKTQEDLAAINARNFEPFLYDFNATSPSGKITRSNNYILKSLESFFNLGKPIEKTGPGYHGISRRSEEGSSGLQELKYIFNLLEGLSLSNKLRLDISLARGLDYYTGTIFEVVANDAQMGSIGGGGRYDNLTGVFGLKDVSGVGVSFGAERIYDVMEELDLFPKNAVQSTTALFINFGGASEQAAFENLQLLRKAGISAELYPSSDKFQKQMKFANNKGVAFVIFVGEDEIKENKLTVKNMESGEQNLLTMEQTIKMLSIE